MKRLKDILDDVVRDHDLWDYYGEMHNIFVKFEDILNAPYDFVSNYLTRGDKMPSEIQNVFGGRLDRVRILHTIIIFLFGLFIYREIMVVKENINKFIAKQDQIINKKLIKSLNVNENTKFNYYWFLVCFFHDFAYSVVSNKEDYRGNLFGKLRFSGANKAVEHKVENIIEKTMKKKPISVPRSIVTCWKNYIRYSQNRVKSEKIDHGIFAGAYFYHDRLNDYYKKRKIYNNSDFIDKGLVWSNLI